MEELTIFAVLGKETAAVGTNKCLEWMLLSTDPVRTFEEAREKLEWYSRRRGIEIYQRTINHPRTDPAYPASAGFRRAGVRSIKVTLTLYPSP